MKPVHELDPTEHTEVVGIQNVCVGMHTQQTQDYTAIAANLRSKMK